MAYNDQEDLLQQQQQKAAGGGVIAGSGGVGSQAPGNTGTGFTNLQTYLSANKGSGGGIADNIISQGQEAVSGARKTADDLTAAWEKNALQDVNSASQNASSVYNDASAAFQADPNYNPTGVRGTTYGGPQSAQDYMSNGVGVNDLEKNYQNVTKAAQGFAGDMNTQKAGLQKQYGYGAGFGALDTFLGRQDGRDKIQGWAAGVDPGNASGAIGRVNDAITGGKKSVADAQSGFEAANAAAKKARSAVPQTVNTEGRGIADQTNVFDNYGSIRDADNDKMNKREGGFY